MFTWMIETEARAHASCADVWKIWTDVPSWPKWDHELEWSRLCGPFVAGTSGELKPRGWPVTKFSISTVDQGRGYSDTTSMPLTKVVFSHSVTLLTDSTVLIRHHVKASGLLAPLLFFTLRRKLLKGLPKAVSKLAQLAEGSVPCATG